MLPLYLCKVLELPRYKMVPFQIGLLSVLLDYSENRIYAFNRYEDFLRDSLDESGVVCKDIYFTSETYTCYCLKTGKPLNHDTPPITLYKIEVWCDHVFIWVPDNYNGERNYPVKRLPLLHPEFS